jgi:hypothetical protein
MVRLKFGTSAADAADDEEEEEGAAAAAAAVEFAGYRSPAFSSFTIHSGGGDDDEEEESALPLFVDRASLSE